MSNESTRVYRFGDHEVVAPADLDPEDIKQSWSQVFPGLENAEIEENDDGSVNFSVRAGTKG